MNTTLKYSQKNNGLKFLGGAILLTFYKQTTTTQI